MHIKKDRVHLSGGSPRDHQRRSSVALGSTDIVYHLMQKVDALTSELNLVKQGLPITNTNTTTPIPSVRPPKKEVEHVDVLNSKIAELEKLLLAKEDTIQALQNIRVQKDMVVEETERPLIVREVIDPTEDTNKLKSFIQTNEEVPKSMETKEDILSKLGKLRSIMGGS